MAEQMTGRFAAETSDEAVRQAKDWIHAEPHLRLRTIAKVVAEIRDGTPTGAWLVTVAVSPR